MKSNHARRRQAEASILIIAKGNPPALTRRGEFTEGDCEGEAQKRLLLCGSQLYRASFFARFERLLRMVI